MPDPHSCSVPAQSPLYIFALQTAPITNLSRSIWRLSPIDLQLEYSFSSPSQAPFQLFFRAPVCPSCFVLDVTLVHGGQYICYAELVCHSWLVSVAWSSPSRLSPRTLSHPSSITPTSLRDAPFLVFQILFRPSRSLYEPVASPDRGLRLWNSFLLQGLSVQWPLRQLHIHRRTAMLYLRSKLSLWGFSVYQCAWLSPSHSYFSHCPSVQLLALLSRSVVLEFCVSAVIRVLRETLHANPSVSPRHPLYATPSSSSTFSHGAIPPFLPLLN